MTRLAATVIAVVVAGLTGCDAEPTRPEIVLPLRTIEMRENQEGFACGGVGLASVLRGDPADPEVAWLAPFPGANAGGPRRQLVVWPAGFRAVFTPTVTVVDAQGAPRLRDGDFVDGGCVTGGERLLIVPTGDGFVLDCGPMNTPECTTGRVSQAGRIAIEKAAGRHVAQIRFLDASGKFQVVYEDGSTVEGFTSSL